MFDGEPIPELMKVFNDFDSVFQIFNMHQLMLIAISIAKTCADNGVPDDVCDAYAEMYLGVTQTMALEYPECEDVWLSVWAGALTARRDAARKSAR